jgi:hypothetical protein
LPINIVTLLSQSAGRVTIKHCHSRLVIDQMAGRLYVLHLVSLTTAHILQQVYATYTETAPAGVAGLIRQNYQCTVIATWLLIGLG